MSGLFWNLLWEVRFDVDVRGGWFGELDSRANYSWVCVSQTCAGLNCTIWRLVVASSRCVECLIGQRVYFGAGRNCCCSAEL